MPTNTTQKKISLAIAGTTQYTTNMAKKIHQDHRFTIPFIITPQPKPQGRKKNLFKNPLHQFAEKKKIPIILVKKKINGNIKKAIKSTFSQDTQPPDFLLVVDFGYLIPNWLLSLPKFAALNIHPSDLPKYRGSSPGLFALLHGEKNSAVTLMKMNQKFDQGDIYYRIPFQIKENWTQKDYYDYSFNLITEKLPDIIFKILSNELKAKPQPSHSPTPLARRVKKKDGYISWDVIHSLLPPQTRKKIAELSEQPSNAPKKSLVMTLLSSQDNPNQKVKTIIKASQALKPWPIMWSLLPSQKGPIRVQLLSFEIIEINGKKHILPKKIKVSGKKTGLWKHYQTMFLKFQKK